MRLSRLVAGILSETYSSCAGLHVYCERTIDLVHSRSVSLRANHINAHYRSERQDLLRQSFKPISYCPMSLLANTHIMPMSPESYSQCTYRSSFSHSSFKVHQSRGGVEYSKSYVKYSKSLKNIFKMCHVGAMMCHGAMVCHGVPWCAMVRHDVPWLWHHQEHVWYHQNILEVPRWCHNMCHIAEIISAPQLSDSAEIISEPCAFAQPYWESHTETRGSWHLFPY